MTKPPAFQLYAADFYMDTSSWTVHQVGAYFRLLMHEWINGPLPADNASRARIAGIDARNMQKMWSTVLAKKFIADDAGMYVNRRLEEEREKQSIRRELQVKKGEMGAAKRWDGHIAAAMAQVQPEDSSSSSSSMKEKKKNKSRVEIPEWIPKDAWEGFIELRKKKRAPLTDRAVKLIIKSLDELRKAGNEPGAVLDQSIERSWTSVYELKARQGGNGGSYQRLDKFGKPAPRQKWEDEADRINADYYRRKAADNAPDGKAGNDPG